MNNDDDYDYCISTTIKKKYFLQTINRTKKIEYKVDNDWWHSRLLKAMEALKAGGRVKLNLLCGREHAQFDVPGIAHTKNVATALDIDGVMTKKYFEIHIGVKIE